MDNAESVVDFTITLNIEHLPATKEILVQNYVLVTKQETAQTTRHFMAVTFLAEASWRVSVPQFCQVLQKSKKAKVNEVPELSLLLPGSTPM